MAVVVASVVLTHRNDTIIVNVVNIVLFKDKETINRIFLLEAN